MTTFGLSHTETLNSCWYVVNAINSLQIFDIAYPADHKKQQEIANAFLEVSGARFGCCAGAIDGMLIWTHRPSDTDCAVSSCSSGKFHCSRKHKLGLNYQAVSDVRGRILDLSILFPGSTSDVLAFEGMALYDRLENGLLAPGLCLFGDNAYLDSPYMATPYSASSGGSSCASQDAYDFYHSQLRIRIECCFGIFTHRWAILRSAIPMNVSVQKTVALVCALAKLHNFCIDEDGTDVPSATEHDEWTGEMTGAIRLVESEEHTGAMVPEQLLHAGEHFDDIGHRGVQQTSTIRSYEGSIRYTFSSRSTSFRSG